MKKVLLITAFCFLNFTFLKAQTNKGKVLLGVSSTLSLAGTGSDLMTLGYTTMKSKSDVDGYEDSDPNKTTSFNLLPKVGYFVIDNLAVGLDVNIALSSEKYGGSSDKYITNMLSIGPFVRYYITTEKVLPFFELGGAFGSLTNKSSSNDSKNKSSVNSFGVGAGIAIPLGDRVTFDVLAGYSSLTIKEKENNDDNYRTVVGTIGLELGVIVFLGGK